MIITKEFLRNNPNVVFVFGDNCERRGLGGAAALRHEPNSYGFITKVSPNNNDISFFRPKNYVGMFKEEVKLLALEMLSNPDKTYYISRLGGGLANRYGIFEKVIQKYLPELLKRFDSQIVYLWEE